MTSMITENDDDIMIRRTPHNRGGEVHGGGGFAPVSRHDLPS